MWNLEGLPRWLSGKESTCNAVDAGRLKFHPRAGKIPPEEGMATQSSKLVWSEEPGGPRSTESQSQAGLK